MLGHRSDLAHVGSRSALPIAFHQRAMHDQVRITPDRTREMRIVIFGQPVMSKRLGKVTRPLQTFEQGDLERLLFRFPANGSKQALQLGPMRQIADLIIKAERELAILREFLRVRIFMHPINRRNRALLQLARDRLIRGQHAFLDELVRFIVFNSLQLQWRAVCIEMYYYFRTIEIERALLDTPSSYLCYGRPRLVRTPIPSHVDDASPTR